MVINKAGYTEIEWSQEAFKEQFKVIMETAHVCVSKVQLDNGNVVYVVPEKLYRAVMAKETIEIE